METLRNEIISLKNTIEENTRRIAEFDSQKSIFEQENLEKVRQLTERDERIQELQLNLEQTQENGTKLRKALHRMKETMTNNKQTHTEESGEHLH
jgi:predicted RNase H-like nuclease (RuvC/YqgF family)